MENCRLCLEPRILRKSHILPEFLYKGLYNEKGHMMGINGRGKNGWKAVQKGLTELLFCDDCEQFLNDKYEKPFLTYWVKNSPLPKQLALSQEVYYIEVPSYTRFKLFHLSVLYRAGVSTLGTYSDVRLGVHEEKLRSMILNGDPGKDWEYLILGYVVMHDKTHERVDLISQPMRRKFNGNRCFSMIYGGVEWWISVVSHRAKMIEEAALKPSGKMPLIVMPWNSLPAFQAAKDALNNGS